MNYKKILILLFFVAVFAYMLAINFYMPLWADDWCRPITDMNVIDILKYVHNVYFHWSGRVVIYFLSGFFPFNGMINIGIFNVFNSLFFVALIYFIFLLIHSKNPKSLDDLVMLLLIFSLVWFVPVSFAEVVLWKSASPIYLWSITATLIFIYPYKKLLGNTSRIVDNLTNKILFFVIGILLGTCLENLSLTVSIFFLGILCYEKVKGKSVPYWALAGICGHVLGTIVLIAAPGNYVRANASYHIAYFHLTLLQKFFMLCGQITLHFLPFVLIYLAVLILRARVGLKNNCVTLRWSYVFWGLSLLSAVIVGGAPAALFYGRTTFVSDIFAIVAVVYLISMREGSNVLKKIIWLLLIIVVLLLQVFDMVVTCKIYHRLHNQVVERENLIKTMVAYNKNLVVAPIYFSRQLNTFNLAKDINKRRLFVSDITITVPKEVSANAKKHYSKSPINLVPDLLFDAVLPKMKANSKTRFMITSYNNKIYYINLAASCDNIKNKQDFVLKVYPKSWLDNKLYAINEIFYLHDKRSKIRDVLIAHKNPLYLLDTELWLNWQDMKSNFNDFSFSWNEAKRATVLTRDFRPVNNVCVIVDYLPDYPIDHIETGQIKDGRLLWKSIVRPITN